jgi:ribosomal protein L20
MKKSFILLVIFIAMLFSTPAFADFPQPPLDFSLAKFEIEVYRFQLDPSLQEKYGFTERVQAQWRGCFDGIDFMFSYMRRGEDDFAGPDYFSLITIRRSKGRYRELWRFRFDEKWKLESCEFSKYMGNRYDSSIEATGSELQGMASAVTAILQDMMMEVKSHEEILPINLSKDGIHI